MGLVHKILSIEKIGKAALHPAQSSLDVGEVQRLEQTGNGGLEMPRVLFSQRLTGGSSRRSFMTVRLQPQMKKYRSLWYKSTTNHNI
jgi:hypothetical protein